LDEQEYFFMCPYCWQEISMLIDPTAPTQHYVEDCEVCCHPIVIRYTIADEMIMEFSADKAQ